MRAPRSRGLSRSVPLLLAWALTAGCAAGKAGPDGGAGDARRFEDVFWTLHWRTGGTESDTTLLQPWRLAVGDRHLFVADRAGYRVAAFRREDGVLDWTFGRRGSGPGEFQLPIALAVGEGGEIWVADAYNVRITVVSSEGTLARSFQLEEDVRPRSMCPLPNGEMLVATESRTRPLLRLSAAGAVVDAGPLPWDDLRDAHPLAVRTRLAPSPDGCVLALVLGRGFAVLGDGETRRYPYLDPHGLPEVQVSGGPDELREMLVGMKVAAGSLATLGEELAVLVSDNDAFPHRVVDLYRVSDGAYLRSYRTPSPVQHIARAEDRFYFLTHLDEYPALIAVEPDRPATRE